MIIGYIGFGLQLSFIFGALALTVVFGILLGWLINNTQVHIGPIKSHVLAMLCLTAMIASFAGFIALIVISNNIMGIERDRKAQEARQSVEDLVSKEKEVYKKQGNYTSRFEDNNVTIDMNDDGTIAEIDVLAETANDYVFYSAIIAKEGILYSCDEHDTDDFGCSDEGEWRP